MILQKEKRLTAALDAMIGDEGTKVPGLGVIVYREGAPVYRHVAGASYMPEGKRNAASAITEKTRFRVASVSKMFTAFAIMQLVEQHRLSLDSDVCRLLDLSIPTKTQDGPITVAMLLSHTSSLRDGTLYAIPPTSSVRDFFDPSSPYYEEGAHIAPEEEKRGVYFHCDNINYGLLGTLIEVITGERFDQYQRNHILRDLDIEGAYSAGSLSPEGFRNLGCIYQKYDGMKWDERGPWIAQIDDYKGVQPEPNQLIVENPDHRYADAVYDVTDYVIGTNSTIFSPQGGLRISYEELGHVLDMLLHDGIYKGIQVLSKESLRAMMTPYWRYDAERNNGSTYGGTIEAYGLGMYPLIGTGTSRPCRRHNITLWGHTGEAYGLLSGLFVVAGRKDGFLYMMNGEAIPEGSEASRGQFSNNYIWEERILDAICSYLYE